MTRIIPLLLLSAFASVASAANEDTIAPRQFQPDERFKADLLLVIAHPDDDVVIGGYLARICFDQHKRVAVVYVTSGDGGGNAIGNESGAALAQIRTVEARRAMHFFGIENIWFLGAHDTPGQDVLRSLDAWIHGSMLDQVVRLVRITRPEVVMTWLPNYVVGENHGDHQAAGVLATEAFDMAGDPTQFPEQVSPPRNRAGMMNLTEGLHTWQPKKLYFFSDAYEDFGPYWHSDEDYSPFRKPFLTGQGPTYPTVSISPNKHESYAKLTAEHQLFYLTQEGSLGKEALSASSLKNFEYPVQLIRGKSLVGGTIAGDVFEELGDQSIPFHKVSGYEPQTQKALSFEMSGPWGFYREFWKAHGLEHLGKFLPIPELAVGFKETLPVPLMIRNDTGEKQRIQLSVKLPDGWSNKTAYMTYLVDPGEWYSLRGELIPPTSGKAKWQELTWTATSDGKQIGQVPMRVYTGKGGGLPQ